MAAATNTSPVVGAASDALATPTGEEQWTKVQRKSRRSGKAQTQVASRLRQRAGAVEHVPGPRQAAASDLTPKAIQDQHNRIREQWLDSDCRRKLDDIISTKAETALVSQAVCFGIGTFDPEDGAWEVKRRTHVQLAAFLHIVGLLEAKQEAPVKCFFQEPAFSPSDTEFIRELGHEVVGTPAGFELVDQSTLVYGVHLYREVYSQAIGRAVPAVFVGTGYEVWDR